MKMHLEEQPVYVLGEDGVEPTYPHTVHLGNLRGSEGNAFVVIGRVAAALKQMGEEEEASAFTERSFNRTWEETIQEASEMFRVVVTAVPPSLLES